MSRESHYITMLCHVITIDRKAVHYEKVGLNTDEYTTDGILIVCIFGMVQTIIFPLWQLVYAFRELLQNIFNTSLTGEQNYINCESRNHILEIIWLGSNHKQIRCTVRHSTFSEFRT